MREHCLICFLVRPSPFSLSCCFSWNLELVFRLRQLSSPCSLASCASSCIAPLRTGGSSRCVSPGSLASSGRSRRRSARGGRAAGPWRWRWTPPSLHRSVRTSAGCCRWCGPWRRSCPFCRSPPPSTCRSEGFFHLHHVFICLKFELVFWLTSSPFLLRLLLSLLFELLVVLAGHWISGLTFEPKNGFEVHGLSCCLMSLLLNHMAKLANEIFPFFFNASSLASVAASMTPRAPSPSAAAADLCSSLPSTALASSSAAAASSTSAMALSASTFYSDYLTPPTWIWVFMSSIAAGYLAASASSFAAVPASHQVHLPLPSAASAVSSASALRALLFNCCLCFSTFPFAPASRTWRWFFGHYQALLFNLHLWPPRWRRGCYSGLSVEVAKWGLTPTKVSLPYRPQESPNATSRLVLWFITKILILLCIFALIPKKGSRTSESSLYGSYGLFTVFLVIRTEFVNAARLLR